MCGLGTRLHNLVFEADIWGQLRLATITQSLARKWVPDTVPDRLGGMLVQLDHAIITESFTRQCYANFPENDRHFHAGILFGATAIIS